MSGRLLLLDTNIIIYLAKKELELLSFAQDNDVLSISSISYMECLGYLFSNKTDEFVMKSLCNSLDCIHLTQDIVLQTIEIRKSHRIKLPNAIIAATAIVREMTLITHNTDDFHGIKELMVLNPMKL